MYLLTLLCFLDMKYIQCLIPHILPRMLIITGKLSGWTTGARRTIMTMFVYSSYAQIGLFQESPYRCCYHYSDVIMSTTASQITVSNAYPTVCSGADQRKHQSSALLAFVRGIHRSPVNSPHKGPVTRKMFPFDDVITRQTDARKSVTTTQTVLSHSVTMVSHKSYHNVYTLCDNHLAGQAYYGCNCITLPHYNDICVCLSIIHFTHHSVPLVLP